MQTRLPTHQPSPWNISHINTIPLSHQEVCTFSNASIEDTVASTVTKASTNASSSIAPSISWSTTPLASSSLSYKTMAPGTKGKWHLEQSSVELIVQEQEDISSMRRVWKFVGIPTLESAGESFAFVAVALPSDNRREWLIVVIGKPNSSRTCGAGPRFFSVQSLIKKVSFK